MSIAAIASFGIMIFVYVIFDISWEGRKFWIYIGLNVASLICKIFEGNGFNDNRIRRFKVQELNS